MLNDLPKGWSLSNLGDITLETRQRNQGKLTKDRLYGVSKVRGLEPMRERVMGMTTDRCRVLGFKEFAYNPMRLNVGSIAQWHEVEPVMVSPDYITFGAIKEVLDPDYLRHIVGSESR